MEEGIIAILAIAKDYLQLFEAWPILNTQDAHQAATRLEELDAELAHLAASETASFEWLCSRCNAHLSALNLEIELERWCDNETARAQIETLWASNHAPLHSRFISLLEHLAHPMLPI